MSRCLLKYAVGTVIDMNEPIMKLVKSSHHCTVPAVFVLAVIDALYLDSFRSFIESFMFIVTVVIFGTVAIDVVRDGFMETTESRLVKAL